MNVLDEVIMDIIREFRKPKVVEAVHPDYISKPFNELLYIHGYDWIKRQEAIFNNNYERIKCDTIV